MKLTFDGIFSPADPFPGTYSNLPPAEPLTRAQLQRSVDAIKSLVDRSPIIPSTVIMSPLAFSRLTIELTPGTYHQTSTNHARLRYLQRRARLLGKPLPHWPIRDVRELWL